MSIFNSMYAGKIQQMKDAALPQNGLSVFEVGNTYIVLEITHNKAFIKFATNELNISNTGSFDYQMSTAKENLHRIYFAVDYELPSDDKYMIVSYSLNDKINFLYTHGRTSKTDFDHNNRPWLKHLEKHSYDHIATLDGEELYEQIKDKNLTFEGLEYPEKLKVLKYDYHIINSVQIFDDEEFMQLIEEAEISVRSLDQKNTLRYNKLTRSPEDTDYYDNSDFFAFLAKDKFVEVENGMYQKDVEIENLYRIDPDSVESNQAVGMMKLRTRFQQDTSLYILTTTKGTLEEFYDNGWAINKPEYKWIRDAIMQKAVKHA